MRQVLRTRPTTALNRLSAAANAPIFSYLDVFFDGSIVGGSMHSIEEGRAVAAAAAIRILNGEKAGDVKIPPSQFELPRFDWRQMQRLGNQREQPAAGQHSLLPRANGMGAVFVANRADHRRYSLASRAYRRSCCANIVGVNLPKCSPGSAWRNWPMSTASRPLAN